MLAKGRKQNNNYQQHYSGKLSKDNYQEKRTKDKEKK